VNDLEPAAFDLAPDLSRVAYGALRVLQRPVRMSGSGSSLFTPYDDLSEAVRAAESIRAAMRIRAEAVPLAPAQDSES
jgi:4-diphosphocytidyl-2C-methyl-D-erythritol kinase